MTDDSIAHKSSEVDRLDSEQFNPYQAPQLVDAPTQSLSPFSARVPKIFVCIGVLLYHSLVFLLLRSNSVDRQAGALFLLNTPVMSIWILCLWRAHQQPAIVGLVAAGMQVGITGAMIVLGIGDIEAVCVINGAIVIVIMSLAGLCWKYSRNNPTINRG